MNQSPINLPYQRFRPIRGLYPAEVSSSLWLQRTYLYSCHCQMVVYTLYCQAQSAQTYTLLTLHFFLEVLWSVVNCYIYSIGPVHFVVGDNRLSYAPWPHPLSPHFQPESSHQWLWTDWNNWFRSPILTRKSYL